MSAERERLIALLEANHRFPGPFFLSVITLNDDDVGAALRAAVDAGLEVPVPAGAWQVRASSGGRYTSHRVTIALRSADDVLALYERVRSVAGVVTML
jgi:putative lipoic acid-binding regulatory protein